MGEVLMLVDELVLSWKESCFFLSDFLFFFYIFLFFFATLVCSLESSGSG